MNIYQNEHLTISLESHIHVIQQKWEGVPSSENFYKGCLISMNLAIKHQIRKWLLDQRELMMFNPKDLQWCTQKWLPELIRQLGANMKIAVVLQDMNQFGKLGSDILLRAGFAMNPYLESRYFLDNEEAKEWLITKRKNTLLQFKALRQTGFH